MVSGDRVSSDDSGAMGRCVSGIVRLLVSDPYKGDGCVCGFETVCVSVMRCSRSKVHYLGYKGGWDIYKSPKVFLLVSDPYKGDVCVDLRLCVCVCVSCDEIKSEML